MRIIRCFGPPLRVLESYVLFDISAFRSGDPRITLLIKQVRPTSGMACYGLISMMEMTWDWASSRRVLNL
jgi:hypothetical protein